MDFKTLKADARNSMKGKYVDYIKMTLVFVLITAAAVFVGALLDQLLHMPKNTIEIDGKEVEAGLSAFSSLATLLVSGLCGFGEVSFFLKISRNEEVTWKELFSKTGLFVPYLVISLLTALFIFLWSLLFIIPGIIAAISYSFVYLVKLDNLDLSATECLRKSKELLKGHKMELFLLELSFIGWALLGALTLGILYIWLVPYMEVTECNFYNKLVAENNPNAE